jgi:uncharacterized integral membrane protein
MYIIKTNFLVVLFTIIFIMQHLLITCGVSVSYKIFFTKQNHIPLILCFMYL